MMDERRPIQMNQPNQQPLPQPHEASNRHRALAREIVAHVAALQATGTRYKADSEVDPIETVRVLTDGISKLADMAAEIESAGDLLTKSCRFWLGAVDVGVSS